MATKKSSKKKDKEPEPSKEKEGHIAGSEEEEEAIDEKVEEEAEEFRKKMTMRPKTVSFTPSTLQRRRVEEPKKSWKPLAAGTLLLVIAIVGLVTSGNLFMTIQNKPLYSPNSGSLKGFILNKDGERLAGARVEIAGTPNIVYANADGKYEFKSLPKGECFLEATFPGYRTVKFPTMILGGTQLQGIGDTNLTLTKVTATGTDYTKGQAALKGQVLDNYNNPESNATVRDEALGKNATTDKDGRFDLGQVNIGKRTLLIKRSSFYDLRFTYYLISNETDIKISLTPGNGTRLQDLTTGTGRLKGQVVDLSGNPMPYALVEANGTAKLTDSNGHFDLNVDAGTVTVTGTWVAKTSAYAKTFVGSGENSADVKLVLDFDIPQTMAGDREALKANLTTCAAAMIGMSAFMMFTAVTAFQRRRFWIAVTGSLFGAVLMLVTFQYAIFLGLIAFALLIISRKEFE